MLVQELLAAKRELVLPRLLKQWGRFDALLIDDLGYVQHSRKEMEVLFNLLAHRYERGSVLITSNLPFSRWEEIFKDPMTTRLPSTAWSTTALSSNSTSPATGWRRRKRSVVAPDRAKSSWPSRPQANGRDDVPGRNTDVDNLPSAGGILQPRCLPAQTVPSTGYERGTTPTQNGNSNCRQREFLVDADHGGLRQPLDKLGVRKPTGRYKKKGEGVCAGERRLRNSERFDIR